MRSPVQATDGNRSATIVPTLLLTLGCSALAALMAYGAAPSWWNSRGAVMTEQVVTNNGVVTTNYVPNNYAVVTQGQLKQFTARAVDELNTDLTNNGGAGSALSNLVYGWQQDYATNGYATNTANPARPYKPSDYTAINVGQLKYIASLIYGQLANAGYTGLTPNWITQNSTTDNTVANLGQLKEVFDFDLTVAANAVQNLTATAGANEIDLSWTLPPVNNATSLTVQESTDGGMTWTNVATLGAASTSYSVADSDPTTSPIFQVTATNPAAPAGGNSTATSSPTAPTSPLPPPQYAVIDLGTNLLYPSKITDSGYVLGYGNSTATSPTALGQYQLNYYVWHNGGLPLTLQPLNSSSSGWIATDIAEDGTVVGLENVYSASLHTQGVVDANNYYQDGVQGDIHNLALWASGATHPTLTVPPVVPVGSAASPYSVLLSGYLEYAGTSIYAPSTYIYQGPPVTGTTPLISSTATAGSPNIWSIQYVNSSSDYSSDGALFDGFTNQSELGTNVVFNSSSLGGTAVFPISVNSSNQCLEEQAVYNNTSPYVTTKYYLGTNQVPITPIDYGHYLSNASQPIGPGAVVKTYVLGQSSDFTQYYCWDGINTITLPQPGSGSIFPAGVNAATATILVPGTGTNMPTSQVVAATQVIGNSNNYGYIWNTIPSTNTSPSFAAPQKFDTLVPGAGSTNVSWSQIGAYGINDGGAIVGTATYSGTNTAIASGSHGVLLLPIQITQSNYPVPTTPTSVIDSGAPTVTQNINGPGGTGIAYITGAPAMPQLTAKINGLDTSGMTVDWRLTVTSEIAARGTQDNYSIPAAGGSTSVINVPINQPWNMNTYFVAPADFFGGNVTVYFTIKNGTTAITPEQSVTFKIRGMNPVSSVCKAQIVANEGSLWYAWAVAKHESGDSSGHLYNQFANGLANGGAGAHGAPGDPFNAPVEGDGYGIFQLDTSSGLPVTTEDVWSWNANMAGWISGEYPGDLQIANNYVNGIKAANPSTFEEPEFVIQGVTISGRDAAALSYYNAGNAARPSVVLHFDGTQPSGQRWTFTPPNAPGKTDSYVNEVISAYNGG